MSIDKIIVLISSLGISFYIYWFFLKHTENSQKVESSSVDIVVDGGYKPASIILKNNKKTTLNFVRNDPSDCLQEVVLPEFGIRKFLPLKETVSIEINPKKPGTYDISCGMNMFHAKIIVEE